MKKFIIITVLLIGIVTSLYIILNIYHQRNERKKGYLEIPTFTLYDINGKLITKATLKKDIPTLFIFFEPSCELCQNELLGINIIKDKFSSYQIVFFTNQAADSVVTLLKKMFFIPTKNIYFLEDPKEILCDKMEVKSTPTIYIYNKNGILRKQYEGPVKPETLLEYLSLN